MANAILGPGKVAEIRQSGSFSQREYEETPYGEVGRKTPARQRPGPKVGRGCVGLRSRRQPVWPRREIGHEAKEMDGAGPRGYKRVVILSAKGTC